MDSGGHRREEQQGNKPWASHCPRRPRQARTQQKPRRDGARGSDRPVPFPDVTYTFSPNRVSLVLFLLLFGKKRSGYRGQQCSDGSTLRRKLLRVRAVWKLRHSVTGRRSRGKRRLSEDPTAQLSGFLCRTVGAELCPERRPCRSCGGSVP